MRFQEGNSLEELKAKHVAMSWKIFAGGTHMIPYLATILSSPLVYCDPFIPLTVPHSAVNPRGSRLVLSSAGIRGRRA